MAAGRPVIYGPELGTERHGQVWSHWDHWFVLVAVVDHDGDLTGLAAALDGHPAGYLGEGEHARPAHLDDLTDRLMTTGIDAAELLGDDELDRTVLAKARRRVVTQGCAARCSGAAARTCATCGLWLRTICGLPIFAGATDVARPLRSRS